jgi:GTPase SAR1 family protein
MLFRSPGADIAFICCDLNESSETNLESVKEWAESIVDHADPSCQVIVVGTKSDLVAENDETKCAREIEALARAVQARRRPITSVRTGNGIAYLFNAIAEVRHDNIHAQITIETKANGCSGKSCKL